MTQAIRVQNFSYTYPTASTPTLRDVSFSVERGRKVLLIGPSGCGKTTLFQCLTGICPKLIGGQVEGNIEIVGQDIAAMSVYDVCRSINLVLQNPDDQLSNITVEDELAFGLENHAVPRDEIVAAVDRALDAVGLVEQRRKYVFHLSGGQRQRLALGSMLALDPPILLLDEPTSNLDPQGVRELMDIIRRLSRRDDLTLVIVQRQADDILEHIDEVALMLDGRIVFQGSPRELVQRFGTNLRDEHGLWLPQVFELALELRTRGYSLPGFPLTVGQAVASLRSIQGQNNLPGPTDARRSEPAGSVESPPAAALRDVRYAYDDGTLALDGVTLDIPVGRVTALLGQNGSGKTTLAMHLVGLLKPKSGGVAVRGMHAKGRRDLASKVGYVFQFPDLQFVKHTVLDELAYGLIVAARGRESAVQEAETHLRALGLLACRDRHPYSLSAGEKRLLSVACMMLPPPDILILDEPTYGLDWKAAHQLMALVQTCQAQGSTIVLVTHDMRLVAEYADHTVVLCRGRKLFEGPARSLFRESEVLQTAALSPPPVFEIGRQIVGQGALTVRELATWLTPVEVGEAWPA